MKRATIINPDINLFTIFEVGDTYDRRDRQCFVGGRDLIHIKPLPIGGLPAMEFLSIPGGNSDLQVSQA